MNDDPSLRPRDDNENQSNPEQNLPASAYTLGRLNAAISERLGDARDEPGAIFTFDVKDGGASGYKSLVVEPNAFQPEGRPGWASTLTFRRPEPTDLYDPEHDEYYDTDPEGELAVDADIYTEYRITHHTDDSLELTKQTTMNAFDGLTPTEPISAELASSEAELNSEAVSEAEARHVIELVRTAQFVEQG